jgi:hypothetical protein
LGAKFLHVMGKSTQLHVVGGYMDETVFDDIGLDAFVLPHLDDV